MTGLVNPLTKRTFLLDDLLSAFMDFSGEKALVKIVLERGVSPKSLIGCAVKAKAAVDRETTVSEREVCQWLLVFIGDRQARRAVARHVSHSRGVPLAQAVRDLYALALDCRRTVESEIVQLAPTAVVH